MPLALILDMDGLMLDTESLAARAWDNAARVAGIPFDPRVAPRLVGRNSSDCRTLVHAHHGGGNYPVDDLMAAWSIAYHALIEREGVAMKPGLVELLDFLDAASMPRAVATSTRRARAEHKLARAGLLARVDALVGGDEVTHGKPAPDIFLLAAQRLGFAPADCLVLEDSPPGLAAAAAAGIDAIVVPDLVPPPSIGAGRAPRVMASLHEVRAWLAGRDGRTIVR